MKKIELPTEILNGMSIYGDSQCWTFVNDFVGWNEEDLKIDGFDYFSAMEGNGIRALETKEEYLPQCCSLRRGNHLKVQVRERYGKGCQNIVLAEQPLFKDFDVVIITNGESLQAFAPVCGNKFELAMFIQALRDFVATKENGREMDWFLHQAVGSMESLAKFLYRNNPNKTKSILDELD